MDKQEIDVMAYNGQELPEGSNVFDEIYWLAMYYLYKVAKADDIPKEQATTVKQNLTQKIEKFKRDATVDEGVINCFNASVKQQTELQKLIEPRAKLKEKSKEELLELIVRFESILNGTLETAGGELCNFSKSGVLE